MKRSAWGSIRQYAPGVYHLRYPLPDDPETGQRRQGFEAVHGSKAEAAKRLAELHTQHGTHAVKRQGVTVAQLWEGYYRPYIERLAPSTVRGYVSAYNVHIKPAFGARHTNAIRKAQIQRWLDGMSYGAARSAFAVLRAMFTFAVDNELAAENVCLKAYALPKAPEKAASEYSESVHDRKTLEAILGAAKGEVWEACYILSAFGGLRREEAAGAKWEDIDFTPDYAIVHIRRGVQHIGGETLVTPLKTSTSRRDAVIPAPYSSRLYDLYFERLGDTWLNDDGAGNPASPDLMAAAYRRWHIGKKYQFIPWMKLRNSYATMLHAHGVELGTIARLLGHSTPNTTFKHYDRMSAEQLASTVLEACARPGGRG